MDSRLALLLGLMLVPAPASSTQPDLRVVVAVDSAGKLGQAWTDAIRIWRDDAAIAGLVAAATPLAPAEREWVGLIEERARAWPSRMPALGLPFEGTPLPLVVDVVVGRGGGEDAFSPAATTIAFDVARLLEVYGPPDQGNGNASIGSSITS